MVQKMFYKKLAQIFTVATQNWNLLLDLEWPYILSYLTGATDYVIDNFNFQLERLGSYSLRVSQLLQIQWIDYGAASSKPSKQ